MTWIIGSSTYLAGAILISDIRITFNDGSHDDCLQKIYPLGKHVMGGFAGSVPIGFQILEYLREEINNQSSNGSCDINILANTVISKIARRAFREGRDEDRKNGCSIIMASADSTKTICDGLFALTRLHVFRSPAFNPINVHRHEIKSIGSGSNMSVYLKALEQIKTDYSLRQTGANHLKMLAFAIGNRIAKVIEKNQKTDISQYLQFGVVSRNEAIVSNLEYVGGSTIVFSHTRRNGVFVPNAKIVKSNEPIAVSGVKLPNLIRSKKEFDEYCRGRCMSSAEATC